MSASVSSPYQQVRVETAAVVDAALTARLFSLNLVAVLARGVLPNTIQLVQRGRPAPTVALEVGGAAHLVSSACSLVTVVVALLSVALVRPTVEQMRPLVLGWMGALLLELAVAVHRGGWAVSTTFVTFCALLTMLWLDVDREAAVGIALKWITRVGVLSLLLVLLAPAAAKYGNAGAAWFTRDARLAGPFSTPNEESNLFAIGVVLWFAAGRLGRRIRPAAVVQLLVLAVPLLLSQSYTAWLAATAGVLVVLLSPRQGRGWGHSFLWVAVIAAALYPARHLLSFLDNQQSPGGFSGRKVVWAFADQHWRDAFLIGHGPGVWRSLIQSGAVPAWAVNGHSQVLDSLFTGGVIGLSALLALLAWMTLRGMRAWSAGEAVGLACLGVELVRSYTEVPFQIIFGGQNLFVLLVILGLLSSRVRKEAHAPATGIGAVAWGTVS